MNDEILDLRGAIDEIVNQNLGRRMNSEIVYCKLISLDPLDFILENTDEVHIKEEFLVVPKYRPFTKKDLVRSLFSFLMMGDRLIFICMKHQNHKDQMESLITLKGLTSL